jgi:hypothetical protein
VLNLTNVQGCDQWRGRGLLGGLLDALEEWLRTGEAAGCSALYVQNICNPGLSKFLAGRGWSSPGGVEAEAAGDEPACMILVAPTAATVSVVE